MLYFMVEKLKLLKESFDFVDMADGAIGHDCQAYNQ